MTIWAQCNHVISGVVLIISVFVVSFKRNGLSLPLAYTANTTTTALFI